MTIDTDLATLRNPWGLMPDVVTAAADRVESELSRLRHAESQARYYHEKYEDTDLATLHEYSDSMGSDYAVALDRVEAELARLRELNRGLTRDYNRMAVVELSRRTERVRELERELARLREGLRPESLARLFHETYERLAPDHGYKTREDSAVLWEDVPAANRALMIATADAVARALLADTPEEQP